MDQRAYLMESDQEALRLDLKTERKALETQSLWAGLRPGMRVADIGCGSGKTTLFLQQLVRPSGRVVGVDASPLRIDHARKKYLGPGIEFLCRDFYEPLDDLGLFDFAWVRFVLEYHRAASFEIVRNVSRILKPGGILCLVDLDYNCLSHFGVSTRLEKAICGIMQALEREADFDPYVGRKLYSFLYDLGYGEIDVDLSAHHLIFGKLRGVDDFNWSKKVELAASRSGYRFEEYPGGYDEFLEECRMFFADPRRFTYTPIIACRGRKP